MKIDRVLFSLNASPLYRGMWDIVSKVYTQKTNMIPTLIFVGTQEEADAEIKESYGEVVVLPKHEKYIARPELDWTVPWTLYWATANLFPDDICTMSGIDEIPCNNLIEKIADQVPDDKILFPLGPDPYRSRPPIVANGHNTAKGSTFKRVLKIEDDLEKELERIWSSKDEFCSKIPHNHAAVRGRKWWGMDEAYISTIVYGHPDCLFVDQASANTFLTSRRIQRNIGKCQYDPQKLKDGYYWSCHMMRPLTDPENLKITNDILRDLGIT